MTTNNIVQLRRARISNYLDDNATVGYDEARKVSDELGIHYETVRNDLKWLKAKNKEIFKKYNLEGLRRSAKKKVDRLYQLQKDASDLQDGEDGDKKIAAIHLEIDIMKNIHQLECDGIGVLTDEIDEREKEEKLDE